MDGRELLKHVINDSTSLRCMLRGEHNFYFYERKQVCCYYLVYYKCDDCETLAMVRTTPSQSVKCPCCATKKENVRSQYILYGERS